MFSKKTSAIITIVLASIAIGISIFEFYQSYISSKAGHELQSEKTSKRDILPATLADWQSYSNLEFGFEIMYPQDYRLVSSTISDANVRQPILFGLQVFSDDGESRPDMNISIYDKGDSVDVADWQSKNTIYSGDLFTMPPDWSRNFNANADSNAFSQFDGGGKSAFVVWSQKGDKIYYLVGELSDKNLQILSTFQFIGSVDISNWKTYRNEKYGFELKYPPHLDVEFISEIPSDRLAMFKVHDPKFDPTNKVGQEVRVEYDEVLFSIFTYTESSYYEKIEEYKTPIELWDNELPKEKIIKSPSGDIKIYQLHSGLVGPYLQGHFHSDDYIFEVYSIFHDELTEDVLSTFQFIPSTSLRRVE